MQRGKKMADDPEKKQTKYVAYTDEPIIGISRHNL